jgi:hypothetical protein
MIVEISLDIIIYYYYYWCAWLSSVLVRRHSGTALPALKPSMPESVEKYQYWIWCSDWRIQIRWNPLKGYVLDS